MPGKKKVKKSGPSKSSPKGRTSKRAGGGGSRGAMSSAPSAVSSYLKQSVGFRGTGDTLILHGVIAVYQIGQPAGAGSFSGIIDGSGSALSSSRLSPTGPVGVTNSPAYIAAPFVSPALDLLGSAFTRYRVRRNIWRYRPQSGTNSTQQLVFAFAADPCHPLLSGTSAAIPTTSSLESLADSVPFAPWCSWDMDVSSKLTKEWLFLSAGGVGSGDSTAGSDTSRFDFWGSIGCVCATASAATAVNYGVMYLDFEIEFKEFCPISATRPSVLESLRRKIDFHIKRGTQIQGSSSSEKGDSMESDCESSVGDASCSSLVTHSVVPTPSERGGVTEMFKTVQRFRKLGISLPTAVAAAKGEGLLDDEIARELLATCLEKEPPLDGRMLGPSPVSYTRSSEVSPEPWPADRELDRNNRIESPRIHPYKGGEPV
jgi:hypothetical protein